MKYKLENGNTLEVIQDSYATNPRDFDNMGTMICFHGRYDLGDKQELFSRENIRNWDHLKKSIETLCNPAVILPLYLLDHSGITMRTTSFNDPWDSGQVGFIFVSRKKARTEYNCKNITKKVRDKIVNHLISEVETYDQYLTGDVWGYNVEDKDGKDIDSCWGFFGSDPKENGMEDNIGSKVID